MARSPANLEAPRFIAWSAAAILVHAVIFAAPLLHPQFVGSLGTSVLHDDRIYFDYGSRALAGAVPYRDYLIEYPPLAVPLFVVPRLITDRFTSYALWFAAEMLAFDAFAVYLVARYSAERTGHGSVPAALAWYTAFVAALYPLVGTRYDMAPAAVAFAAALAWFGRHPHPVRGGMLTACGALLKVFPAAIAAAAVAKRRGAGWSPGAALLTFAALLLAGGGVWLALGGAASLAYQLGRGLQIETLWAGVLMMVGKVDDAPLTWGFSHSAAELVVPGAGALSVLSLPAQAAMLAAVARAFHRSPGRQGVRFAAAAILAFILPSKVLSPQYLIWLVPFIASLDRQEAGAVRWLFLLACVATTVEYAGTRRLSSFDSWAIAVLNVRNMLLVALFVVLAGRIGGRTREGPAHAGVMHHAGSVREHQSS